jgi:NAD(P) transhydrogenase
LFFSSSSADTSTPFGIPYEKLSIGIPKETYDLEKRVAATPETVSKFLKANFQSVHVETGAGVASSFTDQAYQNAGAKIVDNIWKSSDIVLKVCLD